MKTPCALLLVLLATTACSTINAGPGADRADGRGASAAYQDADASPAVPAASAFSPPAPSIGPVMLMPVTGGAPIMGISLGGNIYQPITGGDPVTGTPLFP